MTTHSLAKSTAGPGPAAAAATGCVVRPTEIVHTKGQGSALGQMTRRNVATSADASIQLAGRAGCPLDP